MSLTLTAVGGLVGITKSVVDTFKSLKDLFESKDDKRIAKEAQGNLSSMKENFSNFYNRMDILSLQLEQSTSLTKMVPAWIEIANLMPVWRSASDLSPEDVRKLDNELRQFMNQSIRDHFSGTFFRTSFDQLPSVENQLNIFRSKLNDLDRTVSAIPPGNTEAFKSLWATITTQFNNLRNAGYETCRLADDIQGNLIHELRESAKEAIQIRQA